MPEQRFTPYLLFVISLFLYTVIGYGLERHETLPLFVSYFALFVMYAMIIASHVKLGRQQLQFWIAAAIVYRLVLTFSLPALSDDFYRFIWDGRLLAAGLHPFAEVPSFYMAQDPVPGLDPELFKKLNATETYTIYPPIPQLFFRVSAELFPSSVYGSVVTLKMIAMAFEIATFWVLARLLKEFRQPESAVLLYALNPLIVLEVSGNLHHEGIMVFFLFVSIYLLKKGNTLGSCVAWSLAIATKLIPLLFLPLFVRYLGWSKAFRYWALTGLFTLLLFLPLLSGDLLRGLTNSLGYYFQRFEFNASFYYLIREVGYILAGFNIIHYAGPALAGLALLAIWFIAIYRKPSTPPGAPDLSFFTLMLWSLALYFVTSTTLHPWYIITLFAISIFTPYRFPWVWTAAIFLTYAGYDQQAFHENLWLVSLEYVIVTGVLLYETVWKRRIPGF